MKLVQVDSGCETIADMARLTVTHCQLCGKGRRRITHCHNVKAKHCQMCHRKVCGRK